MWQYLTDFGQITLKVFRSHRGILYEIKKNIYARRLRHNRLETSQHFP